MYTYGVEKWNKQRKEWVPCRFELHDLEEVEEVIDLLEVALPDVEYRPAQYTVEEYIHITEF